MIGVGTFRTTARARRYVNEVLDAERLSYGPFTQRFERAFAASHGCRFAVMTASGTCALQLALAALKARHGWADGDEVIVPAVTFIATSNIVLQNGMRPVFVDVDPVYYELDPDKVEAAITPRTRCIIPVHLFGLPCEMDRIQALATRHGLRIIEDSCETMFAQHQGRSVGAWGDIGCFSTYVAHILVTGVGGICTTNDMELAVTLRSLMNHGRDSIYLSIDDGKASTREELELIIQRRFSFVQLGYSYRVTELEGALGLAAFEEHEELMRRRRENGAFLTERLSRWSEHLQVPAIRPGATHSFMMFPLVLRKEKKAELVSFLEQNGVETRDMLPLINQPVYQGMFGLKAEDYPVATWINESGFYVACHQDLTPVERDYMVEVFDAYFTRASLRRDACCLIAMSNGDGRAAEHVLDLLPLDAFQERILVEASDDPVTPALFRGRGFTVIQERAGKGALLRRALAATTCEDVIVMGLDGADDPRDVASLRLKLRQGNDLVIASRFLPDGGRATDRAFSYGSIGNRFFTFLLGVVFSRNVTDVNNLFRGFKKAAVARLPLAEEGESAMFEMTLQALAGSLRLAECPTVERRSLVPRKKRNRVLSALSFLWILLVHLLSWRARARRRRFTWQGEGPT
ncbi:MAG: DegT/DnrJ/EryC1/StrS family aminotransferase [Planctomycetota bacterium]|nr:DegT/DnrJ/EryC1/StrS family aminotransferase [Planctomycetota bacterium]